MKRILMTTGIAVLAIAAVVGAQGYTFSTNLTVGSTGTDVVALQTWLNANGYTIPAIQTGGVAPGYFGAQTKAAVKALQATKGLPSTGFFGPLTRGVLNAGSGASIPTTGGITCPVGYTCIKDGATATTPVNTGTISTVGAEGIITTKLAPSPIADSNIRIATNVPVYGIEVKAQGSDMVVDRVLLQMQVGVGSASASLSNPATFVRALYAYDGDTLLKSWNLSASDFNKDSSDRYYVIASGMRFVVPKDTTKSLTFKVDTAGVAADQSSRYLTVQGYVGNSQNVRAVDGAGLNSYTDMSGTSNSRQQIFTTSGTSALTATVNSGLSPKATTNRLSTTEGIKNLTMQVIDIKSETGDSTITNVNVYVHATSTSGLPSTLYLYNGSTRISSQSAPASDVNDDVNFSDLNIVVPKDTTIQLTVKADFPTTAGGQAASTSVPANGIKWTKPDSTTASTTPSSALTSNDQYLFSAAPKWELVSASSVSAVGTKDVSSSTVTATIVLKATSLGGSMTKPVATDFGFAFASSTQTSGAYTSANSIPVLPTIAVTPADRDTVGDGDTYTVTLTGILSSGTSTAVFNPALGTSYTEYGVIKSITSTVGGNTITNQTWGIDTFYTPAVALARGTY